MNNQQKIKDLYKKLPQPIREIIGSPELNDIVVSLSKTRNLTDEQTSALSKIVSHTLLGIEANANLRANISKITGIDPQKIQSITDALQAKIFSNLDSLHKEIVYNSEIEDAGGVTNPVSTIPNNSVSPPPAQRPIQNQPQNQRPAPPKPPQAPKQERQSNVGSDFEQTILNQARAMRPAEPADGRVTSNEIRDTRNQTPPNLPAQPQQNIPTQVHNYNLGTDPYRESLE